MSEATKWFRVDVTVDRKELPRPVALTYVMQESELKEFQDYLGAFQDQSGAKSFATFAGGDQGPDYAGIPVMFALAFDGLNIAKAEEISGFEPMSCYSITLGAARLCRDRSL